MPMCNWLCISCPAALLPIWSILSLSQLCWGLALGPPMANWWSLLRVSYAGTWRWRRRGGGDRVCSILLRAAGGAWQWEGARPGSDHCDAFMEFSDNCCQAHLYILLSNYKCCAILLLYPAQLGGTFTTVLYGQIICTIKALMITWNDSQWQSLTEGQHPNKNGGQY